MRISQREARRLRKRVQQLEGDQSRMRRTWGQEFPGGVEITRVSWADTDTVPAIVRTARKLGHAVVVVGDDGPTLRFMALPLA